MNMQKLRPVLMYVVIIIVTLAYARKMPDFIKKIAGYLPGSDVA